MEESLQTLIERHEEAARKYLPRAQLVIGGEEWDSGSGGYHSHVNPATGRVQAEVPLAGPLEVGHAVDAARAALPAWQSLQPRERRHRLTTFAALVREYPWGQVQTLENGLPKVSVSRIGAVAGDWLDYYAGWADRLEGTVNADTPQDGFIYTLAQPYGVIGLLVSWNAPVIGLSMKLGAALAAGNTVVFKPSEQTPFTGRIVLALAQKSGIPDGVINLVPGGPDAGEALVRHPGVDKVSFTGGPPTARAIMRAAADTLTPVVFELGGKGANLIFDDADIEEAVGFTCRYGLINTSQACSIPTRIVVQRGVYDDVVQRLESEMKTMTVGDPFEDGHIGGPLVNETSLKRVLGMIDEARQSGAGKLLVGGSRMDGELADGYFVENTLFVDVDPESALAQQEVFGPVLSVIPFDTEEQAVAIANGTPYGLSNYIQSRDARRVRRLIPQLRSGSVGVNTATALNPTAPFGGVGASGFGREGGREGVEEFVRRQAVHMR